jgi:hypothetical protein
MRGQDSDSRPPDSDTMMEGSSSYVVGGNWTQDIGSNIILDGTPLPVQP